MFLWNYYSAPHFWTLSQSWIQRPPLGVVRGNSYTPEGRAVFLAVFHTNKVLSKNSTPQYFVLFLYVLETNLKRFYNAGAGYTGIILFSVVCLNYFTIKSELEKLYLSKSTNKNTLTKPNLSEPISKCIRDFKQSFSNTFLEISLALYQNSHYSFH